MGGLRTSNCTQRPAVAGIVQILRLCWRALRHVIQIQPFGFCIVAFYVVDFLCSRSLWPLGACHAHFEA